jgi:hypothetical protein
VGLPSGLADLNFARVKTDTAGDGMLRMSPTLFVQPLDSGPRSGQLHSLVRRTARFRRRGWLRRPEQRRAEPQL